MNTLRLSPHCTSSLQEHTQVETPHHRTTSVTGARLSAPGDISTTAAILAGALHDKLSDPLTVRPSVPRADAARSQLPASCPFVSPLPHAFVLPSCQPRPSLPVPTCHAAAASWPPASQCPAPQPAGRRRSCQRDTATGTSCIRSVNRGEILGATTS
jgi:hypothetical protein